MVEFASFCAYQEAHFRQDDDLVTFHDSLRGSTRNVGTIVTDSKGVVLEATGECDAGLFPPFGHHQADLNSVRIICEVCCFTCD